MSSYKEYAEVPAWEQAIYKDKGLPPANKPAEGVLIWAGKVPPPPIGEKINVHMNALGEGKVVGYFSEGGYLGLLVMFDNPPEWYVKQNKSKRPGCIFGPEFRPLEA